jgi:hypothetical protein
LASVISTGRFREFSKRASASLGYANVFNGANEAMDGLNDLNGRSACEFVLEFLNLEFEPV